MITIYHPIDCSTPGEPFVLHNKASIPYYLKKGYLEERPTEIPVEVLNANLMKDLRIELEYLREDYGNGEWEIVVQEEYDERKIEGKFRSFAEVSSQIEYDEYTSAVLVQLKKDNPLDYDELKDEYEASIWDLYDEWILEQAERVIEIRQGVEDAADAVDKEMTAQREDDYDEDVNAEYQRRTDAGEVAGQEIFEDDILVNEKLAYVASEERKEQDKQVALINDSIQQRIDKNLVDLNNAGLDKLDICKGKAEPIIVSTPKPNIEEEEQISTAHICETCGGEHDGTMGSGRFCSRKCSSTFGLKRSQGKL